MDFKSRYQSLTLSGVQTDLIVSSKFSESVLSRFWKNLRHVDTLKLAPTLALTLEPHPNKLVLLASGVLSHHGLQKQISVVNIVWGPNGPQDVVLGLTSTTLIQVTEVLVSVQIENSSCSTKLSLTQTGWAILGRLHHTQVWRNWLGDTQNLRISECPK